MLRLIVGCDAMHYGRCLGAALSMFGYKNELVSSLKMLVCCVLSYLRQLQSECSRLYVP